METQSLYQRAIKFATLKHMEKNQTIPGSDMPYVVHLSNVAMEILIAAQHTQNFNLDVAIQNALLHDTLEDTSVTFDELKYEFGKDIAEGVAALTKNDALLKEEKMQDSLNRVKRLSKEVWAVKLADRITNLQKPPAHWDKRKKAGYQSEAMIILTELEGANKYLEERLSEKILEYGSYVNE